MNKRFYFTVQVDVDYLPVKMSKEDIQRLTWFIGGKLESCRSEINGKNMHGGLVQSVNILTTYDEKGKEL